MAVAAVAAAVMAPAAVAAPALTGEFEVDGSPGRLAVDATGTAWVSVPSGGSDTVRVTPAGATTSFDLPGIGAVAGITRGPDGRMWALGDEGVVGFLPADPAGSAQLLAIGGLGSADDLTFGPGGRLYATGASGGQARVFIIDPAAPPGTLVNPGGTVVPGVEQPRGIAAGGDGRLYIGDFAGAQVVAFDPAGGTPQPHPVGGGVQAVVAGPGGQIAYTVPNEVIGRLTPGGAAQPTTVPGSDSFGLAFAADGAYWAPGFINNRAIRFATDGTFTEPITFSTPPGSTPGPRRVAAGPDGTVWYSIEYLGEGRGAIARIAGLEPPATADPPAGGGGGGGGGEAAPAPPRLRVTVGAKRVRPGKAIALRARLWAPARLTVRVQRPLPGKRVGTGTCKPPRQVRSRRATACTRWVGVPWLARTVRGTAGLNRIGIATVSGSRKLANGRYRVRVRASAGGVSTPWNAVTVSVTPRVR